MQFLRNRESVLTLLARRAAAPCPLCGCESGRIQGRYRRTLADLSGSQHRVRLVLSVRKFFCEQELLSEAGWLTKAKDRAAVIEWITVWYYQQRLHSSFGYQSSVQFEQALEQRAA